LRPDDAGDTSAVYQPKRDRRPRITLRVIVAIAALLLLVAAGLTAVFVA
jgi:hypothetical protein